MRPFLVLSWLVRAQVGAKRGKLMLFGELRVTKMDLRGTLEAPKEAPREPKWDCAVQHANSRVGRGLGEPLGACCARLGISKRPLGSLFGSPGEILWSLGAILGALWGVLRGSWKHFGEVLGAFEVLKEVFGYYSGGWRASLMRFAEILKNHEKHCTVLQKSSFGGTQNQ